MEEIKKAGIKIHKNTECFGIPQGTPISAVASNVYVFDFDLMANDYASSLGGLYRRYSDDIIIVVPAGYEVATKSKIESMTKEIHLNLNTEKTENNIIKSPIDIDYQYLGFNMSKNGAVIRGFSVSRQGRKLSYALKKLKR